MRDIRGDALKALALHNHPPQYFVWGGVPARLNDKNGSPQFEVCRPPVMRSMLSDCADWYTLKAGKKDGPPRQVVVPEEPPAARPQYFVWGGGPDDKLPVVAPLPEPVERP
jgi:hypothetical protein